MGMALGRRELPSCTSKYLVAGNKLKAPLLHAQFQVEIENQEQPVHIHGHSPLQFIWVGKPYHFISKATELRAG